MYKYTAIFLVVLTALFPLLSHLDGSDDLIARGGGRGGGGFGGAGRGGAGAGVGRGRGAGAAFQRTPTMSRAGAAAAGAAVSRNRNAAYGGYYPATPYYSSYPAPDYFAYPQTGYPPI